MTFLDQSLVAIIVALLSGFAGRYFGTKKSVDEKLCCERRESCFNMVLMKIGELTHIVEKLEKAINSKLLGL